MTTPGYPPGLSGPFGNIPNTTTFITTHDHTAGKAIVKSAEPGKWQAIRGNGFNVAFTTSEFPVNLNDDADIRAHENVTASGKLGLVNPHGTVCRFVDFAPRGEPLMHRTQSLDYGILLEGEMEMTLDSGELQRLKRGDIVIQRATMHAWRNPSETEWARMVFVMLECQPLVVNGEVYKEELGHGSHYLPKGGRT